MFTGIIEKTGKIISLQKENNNLHITVQSAISSELKIEQSVSHNGVCLTVADVKNNTHSVTAIHETLLKSNLNTLNTGDVINLERSLKIGDRLDGHFVQGHVDTTAQLIKLDEQGGSYEMTFAYDKKFASLVVEKGSTCLNGISLTIVKANDKTFSVAIIPYTLQHTNMQELKINDIVNVEFDIAAKYFVKMIQNYLQNKPY